MQQTKEDKLVKSIQELCILQKWTLSLAESCTGGHLAARLTNLPGCSQYFLGSLVTYSNTMKVRLLGIEAALIAKHGAVSAPVVTQMAQAVLKSTGSEYSLAVSGIAGPAGGSLEKPIGTIWGAMASQKASPFVWKFHLSGNRQEIIEKSVDVLLSQFWLLIKSKKDMI